MSLVGEGDSGKKISDTNEELLKFNKVKTEKLPRGNGTTVRSRKNKLESTLDGTEKRKRSSNFHPQEIEDLLSLIDAEKSIIECKKTDQLTNGRKDRIWNILSQIFNRENTTRRSDKQLRSKWETLKKIARKEYASGIISAVSNKVLKIMLSCNEMELKSDNALKLKDEPFFDIDIEKSIDERSEEWNQEAHLEMSQMKSESQTSISRKIISSSEDSEEVNDDKLPRNKPGSGILYTNHTDQHLGLSSIPKKIQKPPKAHQSEVCKITKATQYDLQDIAKTRHKKKLRYIYTSFPNFGKIFFEEENKRKRKKHQLEMAILRMDLSIKKRQLRNLRS